jgi:hypothetical protein
MTTINNWAVAALLALAISCSYMLDGPDEVQSKQIDARNLQDAKAMAQEEEKLERAATQMCVKLNGPKFIHRWTEDGKLTCIPRSEIKESGRLTT